MTLAEKIIRWRDQNNLDLSAGAARIGIRVSLLSMIEGGKRNVSKNVMRKLIHVDPDTFTAHDFLEAQP